MANYNYNYGRAKDYDAEDGLPPPQVYVREYRTETTAVNRPNYARQGIIGCGIAMCCLLCGGLAAFIVVMILMNGINYSYRHDNYYHTSNSG